MDDNLLICEACKTKHDLDDGFLNISDICHGNEKVIEDYEAKHNVYFSDFWCSDCTEKVIKEIEEVK
jgi:hypothetical protein